ncbi:MAG: hypothetical protein ACRC62_37025 [Microcoleus sp.]
MLLELQEFVRSASDAESVKSAIALAFENRYISPYDYVEDAIDELLHAPKISRSRLKERGWTDRLIESFLPEPSLHPNPHGYAHQMRLWLIADVAQAEVILDEELKNNRRKKHAKSVCNAA